MEDQQNATRAETATDRGLPTRFRFLGLFPLIFFLAHALYYLHYGGMSHLFWMCNIGNMLLSVGLLFGQPILIRVAVLWLIPGLPIWFWFVVLRGGWLLTSMLAHVGGLTVGLIALARIRADHRTWLYATAWYLVMQQVSRMFTPVELNINLAHRISVGWEASFGSYWQFWLMTTLIVAAGLWLIGIIILTLLPPRGSGSPCQFRRVGKSCE